YLWREERPEVTKKVTWAASLGDRSENADYQYNKKRLREIDRRGYVTKAWKASKTSPAEAWGATKAWANKVPTAWPQDGLQTEKGS
ncbi:hypothetical protein ONO57_25275, partial [Salmonella enterica subsp. enterica serovar Anatum]|nr:hypothetical protein [Salmonella enterica subsp. enterica serovar Anatum]